MILDPLRDLSSLQSAFRRAYPGKKLSNMNLSLITVENGTTVTVRAVWIAEERLAAHQLFTIIIIRKALIYFAQSVDYVLNCHFYP